MPNNYSTGSFSSSGWTINTTPAEFNAWSSLSAASNKGGFSFAYDGIPTNTPRLKKTAALNVDYAYTGSTDSILGGYSTASLYLGPNVGINIGGQTILALGLSTSSAGNQLSGYGNLAGLRVGSQPPVGASYNYDYSSGAIIGGKIQDSILGQAYGIGAAGIENYGVIDLGSGIDGLQGINNVSVSYGIINWGLIDVGDGADVITGIGTLAGIYNFVDLASPQKQPRITTGSGRDIVTGQAGAGNNGIVNNGFIGMGSGDDLYQSVVSGSDATNYFGGTGEVAMGSGNDIVQGFGTGTFFGGNYGVADGKAVVRPNGQPVKNYDSLYLIIDQTYVITAVTTTGNQNQTLNGFSITNGGKTMNVFGFESFGTNAGDQQTISAGTFNL